MPTKKITQDITTEEGPDTVNTETAESDNHGKIEVSKDKLDAILTDLEALRKADAQKTKTIEMLMETADKARMARYQEQNALPIVRTYKLRMFKGKVVVGWHSVEDEMYKDGNGVWHERQIVEVVTHDGERAQLPYLESEKLQKIVTKLVAKTVSLVEGEEKIILKLETDDGKQYDIDQTYVN